MQIATDHAHEIEDFAARADFLSMLTTYFDDPKLAHNWLDRYRNVTREDVQRVAREHLRKEDRVTLHYVPQQRPAAGGAR